MATVTEVNEVFDGGVLMLSATVVYDDVTGLFTRVDWSNPSAFDWNLVIESDAKPPLTMTARRGRTGSVTNFAAGYTALPLLISMGHA